jgi:4-hydroxy-2-oxoheptanedioate aldolase
MSFRKAVADTVRPLLGMWIKLPALTTVEVLAGSGLNFLIVDLEHSYLGLDWLHTVCAVSQPRGVHVLVRVPDTSGREMSRILDTGVDGVIIPRVRSVEDVRRVVSATRFRDGDRGIGITSRAGDWGLAEVDDYLRKGDQSMMRCIQFETRESFVDLDRMLDVPHLGAAFFGPADFAFALGEPVGSPRVNGESARLVSAALERGIACGTAVATIPAVAAAARAGYRFIAVSTDVTLFARAAEEHVAAARDAIRATP